VNGCSVVYIMMMYMLSVTTRRVWHLADGRQACMCWYCIMHFVIFINQHEVNRYDCMLKDAAA